jgi:hypothetical protein
MPISGFAHVDENNKLVELLSPMPIETFLETFDKDANQINLIGYSGEIAIAGDFIHGNSFFLGSGETENVEGADLNSTSLYKVSSQDFGAEVTVTNVDDPESPIQLGKYEHSYGLLQAELKAEFSQSVPEGYLYSYITRSDAVAGNDTLQDFVYGGYNDASADIIYARRRYFVEDPTAAAEFGQIVDSVMKNGSLYTYFYLNSGGITLGDADEGTDGIALRLNSGTAGLGDLTTVNNGTHLFIDDTNQTVDFLSSGVSGFKYDFANAVWRLGDVDGSHIAKEDGVSPFSAISIGDAASNNNGTVLMIDDANNRVTLRDEIEEENIVDLNRAAASNFTLGLKTRFSTGAMAGANPTNAELVTAFGAATGMQGYIGILDANGDETDIYIVTVGSANDYWYVKFTQAA